MQRTMQYLCLTLLLSSAAGNANAHGRKQAVISVGGQSDMQGALLRTAKFDADPAANADSKLDTENFISSKIQGSAAGSVDSWNAPASKEVAELAAQADSTNASDPDMDKAMAGIDQELMRENNTVPPEADTDPHEKHLKFQALNKLLAQLQTEQNETGDLGDLDKSLEINTDEHLKNLKKIGQQDASDLEQSLADLQQLPPLPNAASLLQLEVDDETNHRMSGMLHRMGMTGAHIKHLTRRIEGLGRLHHASQNGASLLELSKPRLPDHDDIKKTTQILTDGSKMLDKEMAEVEKVKWHQSVPEAKSLSQLSSSSKDMAWVNDQLDKHGGVEKIDHAADQKLMDELLAKFEAKYS
eukprot:gnl/MRDRNA2_/MRDRNA2_84323_c0_seq1.p1 gnl/MRDRNA2_/MRDRNA2_84323_c0~~gnl/MRDRNA2_/MRDRNA2_84323_c0_seq1.p1  ORF type:complete len:356 (+),score=103.89 gnl/MRDRNA2_/MRDRNA2_84323_c0_seq1:118-1185(+)